MKKALPIIVLAIVVIIVAYSAMTRKPVEVEPIAWYGPEAHPYVTEVKQGAEAYAKDGNTKILTLVGSDWTQGEENNKVEILSTQGHKAFSIYPGDAAGANGLFEKLRAKGQYVVAYGAEPDLPTPAAFTVATNIPEAAKTAARELIRLMGDKGKILNVLETVTDINTQKRDRAIREVVAQHPNVQILQTVTDMTQVDTATNKIGAALVANGDQIDGVITTGYNPTIAAAAILTKWNGDPKHKKKIRFVGIDTADTVLKAIKDGYIDETIAQNPFGHGYISCNILDLMLHGYTPKNGYQFIDAGIVIVNKNNVDTFRQEVQKITNGIKADLTKKYLNPPAGK